MGNFAPNISITNTYMIEHKVFIFFFYALLNFTSETHKTLPVLYKTLKIRK